VRGAGHRRLAIEVTPETGWRQRWERDVGLAVGSTEDRLADVFELGSVGAMSEPEVQAAVRAVLPVYKGRRSSLDP